jgi:hypothetical protein
MKPVAVLGLMLIVVGIVGLLVSHVSWTETKPVVDLGLFQIDSHQNHTVWIPTAAGVMAVLAGIGLVFAGKRAT